MTLNGVNPISQGMVPISVSGGYDMPIRREPFVYDWGDEWEPLFGDNYTAWSPRIIEVKFIYDSRRGTPGGGTPVQTWLDSFVGDITLSLTEAGGGYGTFTVRLLSAFDYRAYKSGNATLTVQFEEQIPSFPASLPSKVAGSPSIDGYSLSQFGCHVVRSSEMAALGLLKESAMTQGLWAPKRRALREPVEVSLDLVMQTNNPLARMYELQSVLAQGKVLPFVYGNYTFDCICVSGFQATKLNSTTLRFNLFLLRL